MVNKLKRKSENNYFQERCVGGSKSGDFWSTMKPYFSKKSYSSNNKIILQEGDTIISDNQEVSEVFNEYFVNVAKDIGKDYVFDEKNYPSLQKIEEKKFEKNAFEFVHTNETFVSKLIDKFNVKKGDRSGQDICEIIEAGQTISSKFFHPVDQLFN